MAQSNPTPPQPQPPEKLEPLRQSITVNGTVTEETPALVQVLGQPQLEAAPGVDLDDRLRVVPGFSLFRRSSGLVANPTTQGISLRGLGSSGASRTLLLWDGIPLNSPFGGWIYWTRVDPETVERIEITRGASTSVYGEKAMGGAIQVFTRPPEPWRLTLGAEGGGEDTAGLTGGFSHVWKRVGLSGEVRSFTTDGYYIVPASVRGPIDTHAGVEFVAGVIRLDFFGQHDRFFLRLDTLAEDRKNGTSLTHNSTGLGTLAASWSRDQGRDGYTLSAYHTRENFHASFTSIGAGRRTETVSFLQHAPSEATGFDGIYRHQGQGWTGLAGADYSHVEGSSSDFLVPSGLRFGAGSRNERGLFGQIGFNSGPAHLFLGAREDFTGNGESFFSPSFGINAGRGRLRGRLAAYRSFRAPTLNELFRTFRAGNTITNANPNLTLEKLFGAEAGFDIVGESRRLRVTGFRNSVDGIITNVTLSTTPSLITKQRQNAQEAVTHGVEANFEQRWHNFRGELAYLFADSRYANGLRVPQVAKTQGTAVLTWNRRRTFLSGGVRAYSLQFEDDINTLPLAGYSTVQFVARQGLTRSLSASAAIENLLDHQFLTGKTPAAQIGGPRLWRIGLRWDGKIR